MRGACCHLLAQHDSASVMVLGIWLTHPGSCPCPLSQHAALIQMAKRSFRFSKPVLWRRGRRKGCYSSRSLTPGEKRAVEIADGNITSNTFHIFFYTEFSLPKIVPLSHLMFFFVLVNSFLTWVKEAHSSSHERDPEPEISNSMSQLSALRVSHSYSFLPPFLSGLFFIRSFRFEIGLMTTRTFLFFFSVWDFSI